MPGPPPPALPAHPALAAAVTSPRPAPPPDVSAVIVSYNVRDLLAQALRALERAAEGLTLETFVVDNASTDGSAAMVRSAFPHVRLIANTTNVGFGRANNQAFREATGRYLLILNPDTLLEEGALRALVAFLDAHPGAGAVGGQLLHADGTFAPESRRAFPTPRVALFRLLGLSRLFPRSRTFARYNVGHLPPELPCEVDALSGACMLVRREALLRSRAASEALHAGDGAPAPLPRLTPAVLAGSDGAGLFDEAFFMYGEDLDWCRRIQLAGWSLHYLPEARILHYKGASTRQRDLRYVRHFYGAMALFARKHVTGGTPLLDGAVHAGIALLAALHAATLLGRRVPAPLLGAAAAGALAQRVAPPGLRPRAVPAAALLGAAGTAALHRVTSSRPRAPRRAVVVGPAPAVEALQAALQAHPRAPFALVGRIGPPGNGSLPWLGPEHALRSNVLRLCPTDVVFCEGTLPVSALLDHLRALGNLGVRTSILSADGRTLVGKDRVEPLAAA